MGLTLPQLNAIIKEVNKYLINGKNVVGIKYLNVDYDNRTKKFWRIVFRCWGKEVVFTNTNKPLNERKNLFNEILRWIKEEVKNV